MSFSKFTEIKVWQKARKLSLFIYSKFQENKDFRFRDQIQSASVSIMSNIAEGYGRNTNNEFRRFLEIAQGSSFEVESLLFLAKDLKYLKESDAIFANNLINEITKMNRSLINSLNSNPKS